MEPEHILGEIATFIGDRVLLVEGVPVPRLQRPLDTFQALQGKALRVKGFALAPHLNSVFGFGLIRNCSVRVDPFVVGGYGWILNNFPRFRCYALIQIFLHLRKQTPR